MPTGPEPQTPSDSLVEMAAGEPEGFAAPIDDIRLRARQLRIDGKSARQIADELGVPLNSTLKAWLKGIPPPDWTRRPGAKDELRKEARVLRAQGMSLSQIAATLHVSKSSCSLWLRDTPRISREEQLERLRAAVKWEVVPARRAARLRRLQTKIDAAREIGSITDRELFLLGVGLYWAEGQKDKPWLQERRERVLFVNSDPRMIQVYLAWLDLLGVPKSDRRYRVSIHDSADIAKAEQYWANLVGVPPEDLQRTSLKRHNPLTNRLNTAEEYRGCLVVTVRRAAELYQRIEGWWFGVVLAVTTSGGGAPA